jgi:CHAD domain-containing protein
VKRITPGFHPKAFRGNAVAFDCDQIQKPVRKLRKFVKKMPKIATSEQVHDLRTNKGRLEASVTGLSLDSRRKGQRLLKDLAPFRKRAGKVRDMDVLIGFASSVADANDQLTRSRFRLWQRVEKAKE